MEQEDLSLRACKGKYTNEGGSIVEPRALTRVEKLSSGAVVSNLRAVKFLQCIH